MNSEKKSKSVSWPLLILLFSGSVSWCLSIVKSGLVYSYGMGFWGANGHDGIWHIALINQLAKFRLDHPTFAGEKIFNYHFGFDLLVAFFHLLTGIPVINLYFQILPPIFAFLIGLLTYRLVLKLTESKKSAFLATFFVYFGGSWGWLITFIRNRNFGGESMFWANQAISSLINPPYAFSLVVILGGLTIFLEYLKKPNWKNLIFCSFFFGILIQIKVYAGILVLASLFLISALNLVVQPIGSKRIGKVFWASFIIAFLVFFPFNSSSGSLLVFSPLWFPHTVLAFKDRFFWPQLESAREVYLVTRRWIKLVLAETAALLIFLVGNIGTRIIGLITIFGILKKKKRLDQVGFFILFILFILFFSLVLPLLFIQKGNPWNTIQFFYYFQFFVGIAAGVWLGRLQGVFKNKEQSIWRIFITIAVILLTLPTSLVSLKNDYLSGRPPARIDSGELEALAFLSKQPEGVVLTYPYNENRRFKFSEPKPLYAYETTAYVSALSGKQTYLEDEMNLEISGYKWKARRENEESFFSTSEQKWASEFLRENGIRYIYLVMDQKMNLSAESINVKKIFDKGSVRIFEIQW